MVPELPRNPVLRISSYAWLQRLLVLHEGVEASELTDCEVGNSCIHVDRSWPKAAVTCSCGVVLVDLRELLVVIPLFEHAVDAHRVRVVLDELTRVYFVIVHAAFVHRDGSEAENGVCPRGEWPDGGCAIHIEVRAEGEMSDVKSAGE